MIVKISQVYGMDMTLQTVPKVMASLVGVTGAVSMVGKRIVVGALKMIPGAGSIVGGAIAAGTAGALTKALGSQYAAALAELSDGGKEITVEAAIAKLRTKVSI